MAEEESEKNRYKRKVKRLLYSLLVFNLLFFNSIHNLISRYYQAPKGITLGKHAMIFALGCLAIGLMVRFIQKRRISTKTLERMPYEATPWGKRIMFFLLGTIIIIWCLALVLVGK